MQAGFHSLRSYYLSLFLFTLSDSLHPFLSFFSLNVPPIFFSFPSFFLRLFSLQSSQSLFLPLLLRYHLTSDIFFCTHKTPNILLSLMLVSVPKLGSNNKRGERKRSRSVGGRRGTWEQMVQLNTTCRYRPKGTSARALFSRICWTKYRPNIKYRAKLRKWRCTNAHYSSGKMLPVSLNLYHFKLL